jgi:hypothetical protein
MRSGGNIGWREGKTGKRSQSVDRLSDFAFGGKR